MRMLYEVRDTVLDAAKIRKGDTVLDIGCGDGLLAFGALDRVGDNGNVIFSDISEPLLDRCRELALDIGVLDRCTFVNASADDLSAISSDSVDAVTSRSVLIYVSDKATAFGEAHRVLRPGGRLSIWEPINRFNATYGPEQRKLTEATPAIAHLWTRFHDQMRAQQPLDSDPMLNFDANDLVALAEAAGFPIVHLTYRVDVMPADPVPWELWLNVAPNPNVPTVRETLGSVLNSDEFALFEEHARPVLERGGLPFRSAVALLTAKKAGGAADA